MKRRTTENRHYFTEKLFGKLNAYSIENIAMDEERNFTAIIEAVEYNELEQIKINDVFKKEEIEAKLLMAKKLEIPFFFVAYQKGIYYIFEINRNHEQRLINKLDEIGFVTWWASVKKTKQFHPLNNGGLDRAYGTIFDRVLDKYGQKWGGNVDGFIIGNSDIQCIIDNISIAFVSIDNYKADPARFFHLRGPKYETWYSTVKLANMLKVPHILLTIDKNNPSEEVVGISVIDELTKNGIKYVDNITPPQRIVRGMKNITEKISELIKVSKPPNVE